ncbi:TetR/AcrR family transcriptional regulator [Paractinoplanes globisporus]|uniref:TetR/AcrR family transcriptional regulator n=1 Tax=Paractinoplanes globisporus TaxID=113565 RepID=A0ABW6W3N2_9ACTN|nr:TetR/AcrR family transcriptional regulator [Actinoplanes globisporus]
MNARSDRYRDETRLDLALAAFAQAKRAGLASVRVPRVAEAAGVSTRTFNNYFASKEQAIAWLGGRHAGGIAVALAERPAGEPIGTSLVEAVLSQYRPPQVEGLPPEFLRDFRALVADEPALQGEYLRAMAAAERDLGDVIEKRVPSLGTLRARVLAGVVFGAERAAVRYWMQARAGRLVDVVREALEPALAGWEQTP